MDRIAGQSWWRTKRRQGERPELRRQRSIISAVTLAAISMQNQENNIQPDGQVEPHDQMELRQRQTGGGGNGNGWAMLDIDDNGKEMARTAF